MVKLGIIGLGNMGSAHVRNILDGKCPEVEITAVADRRAERIAWAKEKIPGDVKVYNEGSALIADAPCDAVLIAVPHYDHSPLAIAAFGRGLHVLCEKPAGVYTKQVREMNAAADRAPGLSFGMMFNQRTNCVYRKMKELIGSGELGAIKRVNWIITDWYRPDFYYASGGWRATWAGEGGGVLLNQCPHQLDLLQWICGLPVRVQANCHEGKWHDIEVEDDVTAYMEFENGATGVFVTTTADAPGTNRLEITLDGGSLICENDRLILNRLAVSEEAFRHSADSGFAQPPCETGVVETDGENPQHVGVLNAFAANILRGEPLVADGREGIRGLMLSNAMHLSGWLGKMVDLPVDEDLFLAELDKRRANSRRKEDVRETVSDTSGSY